MASSTTNYNLIKPDYEDDADIKDLNDNFDTIDTAMNNLEEGKQAALTTAQMAAANSGINSTKVAQIETNKNNILSIYNTGFAQKNVMHIVLDEVKAIQSWATFINNTITFGNLSVTFNDDNSITLNGSNTANVAINFKDLSHINIPTNAVGAASANITLSNDIFFGLWGNSGVSNLVLNDGVDIPSDYASKYSRGFIIRVSANTVCNNVRIYPMVCDKALYQASPEVVPYALSNAELTAKEQANETNISLITTELIDLVDSGAKNKLPNRGTLTKDNITYTWVDGNVVVSGTKSSGTNYVDVMSSVELSDLGFNAGDKFTISNNSTNCYLTIIFWSQSQGYTSSIDVVTGSTEITVPTGYTHIIARLGVISAVTGTINETIQPMICTKTAWDISQTYQPYRPSYQELYERVIALEQANQ